MTLTKLYHADYALYVFYTSGAGSVESYFVDCGLRFGFQRGVVAAARRRVAFIYLTERFGERAAFAHHLHTMRPGI